MKSSRRVLFLIVFAQFLCTSLWFAGNGVMADLSAAFGLPAAAMGYLTSVVQLGFISGTLVFALLSFADRFSPSKVLMISALSGALVNVGIIWEGNQLGSLLALRFFTGFFLAGIYPVGMKIAADYFEKGLGVSLGYLVGALVLGTAFPHLLKELSTDYSWQAVILTTSGLASFGGVLLFLGVPDGPFRKAGQKVNIQDFQKVFANKEFRAAALGYFGHMWELYAFWAFVPFFIERFNNYWPDLGFPVSLLSCLVIGLGGLACIISGYLGKALSNKGVAKGALLLSGICCLLFPTVFYEAHPVAFLVFLLVWGMLVIADSPLFSSLVAKNAPAEIKGTALTLVNCIGFAISILSIELLNALSTENSSLYFVLLLAIGPFLGFAFLQFQRK